MKQFLLFLALFFSLSTLTFAQTSVQLNIQHKLADADFAMNEAATNNMNNNFEVTRLEYYISKIQLTHDGGTQTDMDTYILVRANEATAVDLGAVTITNLESITFSIGVDEAVNHEDPSQYEASNPLAPQSPSMHWGWDAGYRFLAMEGNGGAGLSNNFQLHALEDENYFAQTITTSGNMSGNVLHINLAADYTRALEDIEVNNGVVVHGGFAEAKQALENFRDFVFSEGVPTGINNPTIVEAFAVFPNPTATNSVTVNVSLANNAAYQAQTFNALGQLISTQKVAANTTSFAVALPTTGVYFLNIVQDGAVVASQQVIYN